MTGFREGPPLPLDVPAAVQAGAEIDPGPLTAALSQTDTGLEPPFHLHQYPHGFSWLTYRVTDARGRRCVLRTPPRGVHIARAHDPAREHRILSGLKPVYPLVPRALACHTDANPLGTPFLLMEQVDGTVLRANPDTAPDAASMRAIGRCLVANLVRLHGLDLSVTDLADLGYPDGFVLRQVRGWQGRYAAARTEKAPDSADIAAWLEDHLPESPAPTLIHNDYKHDNLVLAPEPPHALRAVLDWEMATRGDPLMDLGSSLAYWVTADDPPAMRALQHSPTDLPGNPTRAEVVEQYAAQSGRPVDDIVFYFVFGNLKLAAILQQLYRRWADGLTRESRYERLHIEVATCLQTARQAMQLGRIDSLYTV